MMFLQLNIEEAYSCLEKTVKIKAPVKCTFCDGPGAEGGSSNIQTCRTCGGSGKVRSSQGFFTIERTCNSCNGTGRTISNPCRKCSGNGIVNKEKSLSVKIPAGVDEGTRIRVAGEGEAGKHGGSSGDLYIFISMIEHNIFTREGEHLFLTAPVDFYKAVSGGSVDVPSPGGGKIRISISAGTQNGKRFRLRGKGMPILQGRGYGDLYVEAEVETPINLSNKQKKMLAEFHESLEDNNSPKSSKYKKFIEKNY